MYVREEIEFAFEMDWYILHDNDIGILRKEKEVVLFRGATRTEFSNIDYFKESKDKI
jgi:hypothetical protein